MISEKAIRFRRPVYNPDRAQTIGSSMSRHLSTCNISSKSMHAFLSNLANRQTDRQTRAKTFTSSFVRGDYLAKMLRRFKLTILLVTQYDCYRCIRSDWLSHVRRSRNISGHSQWKRKQFYCWNLVATLFCAAEENSWTICLVQCRLLVLSCCVVVVIVVVYWNV